MLDGGEAEWSAASCKFWEIYFLDLVLLALDLYSDVLTSRKMKLIEWSNIQLCYNSGRRVLHP